ncbi:MAG: hypothetical protein FWE89_04590, partial [Syntrophaceae bacterium]|nr:hypothetical protein [Syntrophaceae bacterium]
AFGLIGYVLKQLRFETPPLILAFVLGPLIEINFRQAMILADGSLLVIAQRPICAALLMVALGVILMAMLKQRKLSKAVASEG